MSIAQLTILVHRVCAGVTVALCGVLLAPVTTRSLGAQPTVQLQPATSGVATQVVLTRVATLSEVPAIFTFFELGGSVVRDGMGQFEVSGEGNKAFAVFSPTGVFLRRMGREGEGPGEFSAIHAIAVGPGDSVSVFDRFLGRQTVYDPAVSKVVRTAKASSAFFDILLLPDHRSLVASNVPTPGHVGLPLHIRGAQNAIERSFGSQDLLYDERDLTPLIRRLARSRSGNFWVAHGNSYTIEEWTPDFRLVRTLTRTVDWFPPTTGYACGSPAECRPRPVLTGVHEDEAGMLWVHCDVAAARWKPQSVVSAGGASADQQERPAVTRVERNKYIDTMLKQIDPRTGRVLVSTRVSGILTLVGNSSYLWKMSESPGGGLMIEIFSLRAVSR